MASNPFDQQRAIPGVKHIIAVASGKGGVGKSTVASNLAVALGKKHKVALLDADIYGPSVPRLMGALNQKPHINDQQQIEPLQRYGIKVMSIGFLVEESAAVVWRGPMLFKAMDQFFRDVNWGEIDYLVIDLPPGTGDIQLTMAQKIPVSGAVLVSTPQNISLIDVKKAVDMFNRVGVKILGMVENMAYMINPANQEKIQMFPKGEMESYIAQKNIRKIAEVPFHPHVGLACEAGVPIVESNPQSAEAQEFFKLAEAIHHSLH
ncbi:MAG: Mrp/NBP35 family ATP-binding protein [Bdellovibrionia bacterium]